MGLSCLNLGRPELSISLINVIERVDLVIVTCMEEDKNLNLIVVQVVNLFVIRVVNERFESQHI